MSSRLGPPPSSKTSRPDPRFPDHRLGKSRTPCLIQRQSARPWTPALRRTKQGMKRWLRNQKQAVSDGKKTTDTAMVDNTKSQPSGETLAEGMEGEEERVLPGYYDTMAAIPDIDSRLRWIEDSEGNVADPTHKLP
ncbi:hypothetical protein JMJ35_000716 [Cladonia borealis]|uniref:Uncharacterized protein n=1 Tax=Cladonia borealis TaxID=184061 RepID=A0AA39RAZ1_9LECA|nr:hypothetical protein JMJ35_000716 [Cladonia borealis]